MADKLRVLDLFSGIGGFSLGLERAGGFKTVMFCEIEPFCQKVLKKHWPEVPCHDDVTTLKGSDCGEIDIICGGFPCQDISLAGAGAGLAGERSGLWSEIARLTGELRPRYVIVENVAALRGRGLGTVLGDLAALGYDSDWNCIPASAVGAPHRRDRIWIVAHPIRARLQRQREQQNQQGTPRFLGGRQSSGGGWWLTEPNVGRVAHGVPHRVDRIKALGNAVVPQIPEMIGRAIMAAEGMEAAHG